jgi:biotin--protein ligase
MALQILVYDGSGVSASSRDGTLRSLRSFLSHRYDIQTVTPKTLRDEPWTQNCALLVFPGGRDLPYLFDLSGKANDRIRNWVHDGGRYLGICAGAYYAASDIAFEVGTPLEVVGTRELGFFPGSCRGTVFPGFQYDSDAGAREVSLALNRSAWRDHWQQSPDSCDVWYNGGGAFFLPESAAAQNVEVLATYANVEGAPAAGVACKVGSGKAVLWGTHPETSSPSSSDVSADLVKERHRLNLVRASLSCLGLDVSDAPAAPPRLLPLFLASDDLSLVQTTASAIAAKSEALDADKARFADRNDTFILHSSTSASQVLQDARDKPGTEDPEALQSEPRDVCVCDSGLPPTSLTPLFDLSSYFSTLRSSASVGASPSFGGLVLYGEVVTSTQTMLDKYVLL